MSNSDYIIHGSRLENLIKILQCGYINNKPMKKDIIMLKYKPSNQIFTQLIYRNIPNEKKQKPHWWNCVIVLDKKILKDYPFYATRVGGFTNKFENGKTSEHTIIYGEGNLDRMPNLTKLKNIINKVCENDTFDSDTFTHSNEILFNAFCASLYIGNNWFWNNKIILLIGWGILLTIILLFVSCNLLKIFVNINILSIFVSDKFNICQLYSAKFESTFIDVNAFAATDSTIFICNKIFWYSV